MEVTVINNNATELRFENHYILLSYGTPVAAVIDGTFYRTSKRWSVTTSKHITRWTPSYIFTSYVERPQSFFDELLKRVKIDGTSQLVEQYKQASA